MNLRIISTNLEVETGDFCIKGRFDKSYREIYLLLQKKVRFYNVTPHLAFKITNINEDNEFEIGFNVNEFIKHSHINNTAQWDCYFLCDQEKIPLVSKTEYKPFNFPSNDLFRVTPHQNDTLVFIIDSDTVRTNLNSINVDGNSLIINLETDYKPDLTNERVILSFKCREQENLYKYYKSVDINLTKSTSTDNTNLLCLKESLSIFSHYLDNHEFFDIFFEIKNEIGTVSVPLTTNQKFEGSTLDLNGFYLIETKIGRNNQIYLLIKPNQVFKLSNFVLENGKMIFKGLIETNENGKSFEGNNVDSCYFVIKKHVILFEEFEPRYYGEVKFLINLKNHHISEEIDLQLLNSFIDGDGKYNLFIRILTNGLTIDLPFKSDEDINSSYIFNDFLIKLVIDANLNCSLLTIINEVKHQIVKVGVLGSCFSRTAFNSMEYFNPDYKKFYSCTFSQLYHSSIPAVTSKPLNKDILARISKSSDNQNISNETKSNIRSDINKSFFEDLKNANVDYIIIDLYADAVKNLIMFPDGSSLGSFHLNLSELCPNLEFNILSPMDDDNEFFEVFKQSLDKFRDEILKIVPEERIILNKGYFAYKWKNEKGQTVDYFDNQINFSRDINYFWDKINNYFQYKMPNIKIIDLRFNDYIPHYDFPFGTSAQHYEPAYYKEFLNLLNKIVLEDKLEELTSYEKDQTQKEESPSEADTLESNFLIQIKNKLNSYIKKL